MPAPVASAGSVGSLSPQGAGTLPPPAASLQDRLEAQQKDIDRLMKAVAGLTGQLRGTQTADGGPPPGLVLAPPPSPDLLRAQQELGRLDAERAAAAQAPAADRLEKQLEVQRKEIELLNRMVKLLASELAKQGPAVAKMQADVAALDARSKQAAQRDRELANGLDNLNENVDVIRRYGAWLPAPLKELFDPSYNNEFPLSIYGALVENYTQFHPERWGVFSSPTLSPFFLLTLNERIFLEANVDLSAAGGADVPWAQMDFWITDWLTLVIGRYLTPIGFYNERLAFEWGNRLPDDPLVFHQVSPLISTDGVQLRGSSYLFGSPVKLEYAAYFGNGIELANPPMALPDIADQGAFGGDETHAKAVGGRLGLWVPKWGINGGVSGYYDYNYSLSTPTLSLALIGADASYHMGNWDVRLEGAYMTQQAKPLIGRDIDRAGFYAQLAYRPYDVSNRFLQRLELVGRYSMERFGGIDPAQLDFTTFSDPTFVPVDRNQYTAGINYYVYPSLIFKFAYEINQELHGINLHDDVFFGQVVWAF
jgi:hypothetical protein